MELVHMAKNVRGIGIWIKNIADIAVIVLIVLAAKTAIAEPFYVPSGSMEPTLLIGDELLATKFPIWLQRRFAALFRRVAEHAARSRGAAETRRRRRVPLAGRPSQVWVKRVIGLPGDRISACGTAAFRSTARRSAFVQTAPAKPRSKTAARFRPRATSRHCRADTNIRSSRCSRAASSTTCPRWSCRPISCLSWETTATIRPTAACRCARAASDLLPVEDLVGRVDARGRLVGSRREEPADYGLAFRPAAVALFHRGALRPIAPPPKYSTACGADA